MLQTPGIRPPFPAWSPTTNYSLGDVVSYGGQNWVCLFDATAGFTFNGNDPPDLYSVSLNLSPGQSPGIYNPTTNPSGASWVNLTATTPPASAWSPTKVYTPGTVVMYPAWSPGSYWIASLPSVGEVPQNITQPQFANNVNTGIVQNSPGTGTFGGFAGNPQYWQKLQTPLAGSPALSS